MRVATRYGMISSMALVLVAQVACRANCRPLGQYPGAQLTVSRHLGHFPHRRPGEQFRSGEFLRATSWG